MYFTHRFQEQNVNQEFLWENARKTAVTSDLEPISISESYTDKGMTID